MTLARGNCSTSAVACVQFLSHLANVVVDNSLHGLTVSSSKFYSILKSHLTSLLQSFIKLQLLLLLLLLLFLNYEQIICGF